MLCHYKKKYEQSCLLLSHRITYICVKWRSEEEKNMYNLQLRRKSSSRWITRHLNVVYNRVWLLWQLKRKPVCSALVSNSNSHGICIYILWQCHRFNKLRYQRYNNNFANFRTRKCWILNASEWLGEVIKPATPFARINANQKCVTNQELVSITLC